MRKLNTAQALREAPAARTPTGRTRSGNVMHKIDTFGGHAAPGSCIVRLCEIELRSALTSALEELSDHYRVVIIFHDADGVSMTQVAECLGVTVPTAKSRAHRARLLLRKRLEEFTSGAPSGVETGS